MDPKGNLTKEILSEESRFILQNLLNEARHGKQNAIGDIHKLLEKSVSIKLLDYILFLEKYGYVIYNRKTNLVEVTREGEQAVAGEKFAELGADVEYHFGARLGRGDAAPRGELLDKKYEKQSVVGSGGIGTVYLGR